MSLHTGTHVDAPSHFVAGGGGVEALDPRGLVGLARVVDVPKAQVVIDDGIVEGLSAADEVSILLFRTRNSENGSPQFIEDYVAMSPEAAGRVAALGYRGVGIDYLSIEPFGHDEPTVHRLFFSSNVVIIEGLDLAETAPGVGWFVCLPLAIAGADAAPARALFWPSPAD